MRVHATKFDGDEKRDDLGLKWSEKWLRDGNGEWCYGKVSFIFKKKPRMPQKYRIKYHEGTVMEILETDIEVAPEEEAEDETSSVDRQAREDREELSLDDREEDDAEDDKHPLDRYRETQESEAADGNVELESEEDDDEVDDDTVTVGGVFYNISAKRRRVTVGDGEAQDVAMGETVKGKAGSITGLRIEGLTTDHREEPHFETSFKANMFHCEATEVEVFRALMPLDRQTLLAIIRDSAEEETRATVWERWHVDAALL